MIVRDFDISPVLQLTQPKLSFTVHVHLKDGVTVLKPTVPLDAHIINVKQEIVKLLSVPVDWQSLRGNPVGATVLDDDVHVAALCSRTDRVVELYLDVKCTSEPTTTGDECNLVYSSAMVGERPLNVDVGSTVKNLKQEIAEKQDYTLDAVMLFAEGSQMLDEMYLDAYNIVAKPDKPTMVTVAIKTNALQLQLKRDAIEDGRKFNIVAKWWVDNKPYTFEVDKDTTLLTVKNMIQDQTAYPHHMQILLTKKGDELFLNNATLYQLGVGIDEELTLLMRGKGGMAKRGRRSTGDDEDSKKDVGMNKEKRLLIFKQDVDDVMERDTNDFTARFKVIAQALVAGPATGKELIEDLTLEQLHLLEKMIAENKDPNLVNAVPKFLPGVMPDVQDLVNMSQKVKEMRELLDNAWLFRAASIFMEPSGRWSIDNIKAAVKSRKRDITNETKTNLQAAEKQANLQQGVLEVMGNPAMVAQLLNNPSYAHVFAQAVQAVQQGGNAGGNQGGNAGGNAGGNQGGNAGGNAGGIQGMDF